MRDKKNEACILFMCFLLAALILPVSVCAYREGNEAVNPKVDESSPAAPNSQPQQATPTFEQAAAAPLAALTALQGLHRDSRLQSGQKVLIQGASGGVGTFAVQIAKALGAQVTAVCSTRNLEQARSLGAEEVIDYKNDDFACKGRTMTWYRQSTVTAR